MKMQLGFYVDESDELWLLKPGRKLEFWSNHSNDWQKWTGTFKDGLTWIVPEAKAEYIGL